MSNPKHGFVFYFDNYPILLSLPPEQRGWLITALCVFADQVWRDPPAPAEAVLEQFPQLSPQAQVTYRFMAGAISRDTQRWLQQRDARIQRRQQQAAEAVSPPDQTQQERRFQQDAARLRQLMEQRPGPGVLPWEKRPAPGTRTAENG